MGIYGVAHDALVNCALSGLEALLLTTGFQVQGRLTYVTQEDERRGTPAHLDRWLAVSTLHGRLSYARRLLARLTNEEFQRVEACFRHQLLDQLVRWRTVLVYVVAAKIGITL